MDKTLVNLYEARDLLRVSMRTIYVMLGDGRLKKVETRYATMVSRENVEQLLTERGLGHSHQHERSGKV
jgi:hypothetical protein